jgi:hypothetical protein
MTLVKSSLKVVIKINQGVSELKEEKPINSYAYNLGGRNTVILILYPENEAKQGSKIYPDLAFTIYSVPIIYSYLYNQ